MCSDYDTVMYSSGEVDRSDGIILGYKKRLSMIENRMQHLLEDISFDIQQIEPILVDLQRSYDTILQLLRKRNDSLQCKDFNYRTDRIPIKKYGSAEANLR